jgi:hypothetical protein
MGLEHALASEHLYTDGAELLYDYAQSAGDEQLRLLTVVRSGQRVFHDIIDQYLERIDYDRGWAARVALPITEEHHSTTPTCAPYRHIRSALR